MDSTKNVVFFFFYLEFPTKPKKDLQNEPRIGTAAVIWTFKRCASQWPHYSRCLCGQNFEMSDVSTPRLICSTHFSFCVEVVFFFYHFVGSIYSMIALKWSDNIHQYHFDNWF